MNRMVDLKAIGYVLLSLERIRWGMDRSLIDSEKRIFTEIPEKEKFASPVINQNSEKRFLS